jgi:hypothetical protein
MPWVRPVSVPRLLHLLEDWLLGATEAEVKGVGCALGFFVFSFTTTRLVNPLPAAHPAILPISNPLVFGRRWNSAPGKTPTSSSQNSYVVRVALGDVVISTFGGIVGSSAEEK